MVQQSKIRTPETPVQENDEIDEIEEYFNNADSAVPPRLASKSFIHGQRPIPAPAKVPAITRS